jgi:hypothetical protein
MGHCGAHPSVLYCMFVSKNEGLIECMPFSFPLTYFINIPVSFHSVPNTAHKSNPGIYFNQFVVQTVQWEPNLGSQIIKISYKLYLIRTQFIMFLCCSQKDIITGMENRMFWTSIFIKKKTQLQSINYHFKNAVCIFVHQNGSTWSKKPITCSLEQTL